MSRHIQRQHALALIYMHLLRNQSFDELYGSLNATARVDNFLIQIVDEHGEPAPNVHFDLVAFDKTEKHQSKTDKTGKLYFNNVLRGTYTLKLANPETFIKFNTPVFGIEDAVVQSVEKDSEVAPIKTGRKIEITQNNVDIETLTLESFLDDTLNTRVIVETFLPYIYINDDFMNVLYRIEERHDVYERVINSALKKTWRLDRLGLIEQSILLLACAELEFGDVPKTIIVNEAVELAKEYSDEESYKLINGVVDAL